MNSWGKNILNNWVPLLMGFALLLFNTACSNDPEVFKPNGSNSYDAYTNDNYRTADAILQADIVIVMDYSMSMNFFSKPDLIRNLHIFTQTLASEGIQFKIAFVHGLIQTGAPISTLANDFVGPVLNNSSDIASAINFQTGFIGQVNNANENYFASAASKIMYNESSGFLREAAQLVYVFFTDDDDHNSPSAYWAYSDYLKSFKSHPDYVTARALLNGVTTSDGVFCPLIGNGNNGNGPGTWLSALANDLDSQGRGTYCLNDTDSNIWTNLGRNIVKPTDRFKIQGRPDPSSIEIFINGTATTSWVYIPATNEIVFNSGSEPAASASLLITYNPIFELTGTLTDVNSIVVTLNGAGIANDAVNGWSFYGGTNNLIILNGNSRPNRTHNGDRVVINYD